MTTTLVTWKLKGQKTVRTTYVPDGEFYQDWIAAKWAVAAADVVVLEAVAQ